MQPNPRSQKLAASSWHAIQGEGSQTHPSGPVTHSIPSTARKNGRQNEHLKHLGPELLKVRTQRPRDTESTVMEAEPVSHHVISPEVRGQGSQSAQGVEEHPRGAYFTQSFNQKLEELSLVGEECFRLGRHHHTQQQKPHLSRCRGSEQKSTQGPLPSFSAPPCPAV